MGATVKHKGSFIVNLESGAKGPPDLLIKVAVIKEKANHYKIMIIHPNTKQHLYEGDHECKDINAAMAIAYEKKKEFKDVKTWYEEVLHIPQPKRGKMKLKTKEAVAAGEFDEKPAKKETSPSPKASKMEKKTKEKVVKASKKVKKVKQIKKSNKKPQKKAKVKKSKKR